MPQLATASWFMMFIITWTTMFSMINMLAHTQKVVPPNKQVLLTKLHPWMWPWIYLINS